MTKAPRPVTRSDEAYVGLKKMILKSEVLPGQWLRLRDMAARLRVSRTPMSDAFRRLENDGLVTLVPQVGARVRTWTVEEIEEGIELRASLEALVAGRCAAVAEEWQIAQLRSLAEKVDKEEEAFCDATHAPAIQPGMSNADDWRFHRTLAEISGFRLVAREIERLELLQRTCRLFFFPAEPSSVTHMQMVDAIAARDVAAAELIARQSIRDVRYVLPRLRERFGDGPVDFQISSSAPGT